jgi:1-deoxy-D-xylulose 5-phosphate reductoisomerase
LKGEIPFPGIAAVVEETLSRIPNRRPRTVGDILEIDKESRSTARAIARALVPLRTAQPVPARV